MPQASEIINLPESLQIVGNSPWVRNFLLLSENLGRGMLSAKNAGRCGGQKGTPSPDSRSTRTRRVQTDLPKRGKSVWTISMEPTRVVLRSKEGQLPFRLQPLRGRKGGILVIRLRGGENCVVLLRQSGA